MFLSKINTIRDGIRTKKIHGSRDPWESVPANCYKPKQKQHDKDKMNVVYKNNHLLKKDILRTCKSCNYDFNMQ